MIAFHSAENDIGFWNELLTPEPGSDVQNSIFAADCQARGKRSPRKFNSVSGPARDERMQMTDNDLQAVEKLHEAYRQITDTSWTK